MSEFAKIQERLIAFLRWSEKYTKTDMVYLFSGGSWLLLGQGLTFLASLLLVWMFANLLPKEVYGEYRFVLSVVAILSLAALPGMSIALARSVSSGKTGTVFSMIRKKLQWGSLGILSALAVAGYYFVNDNTELVLLFLIVALFVPLYETFADYQYYLQGKRDFKRQSLYRALQRVMIVVAVGGTMLLTDNIFILVFAFFATSTLSNGALFKTVLNIYPPNKEISPEDVEYGKHLSLLNALRMGVQYLDKILLFHFVGPAQLAAYLFAVALPQEITSVFSHVNNLAFPKMISKTSAELKSTLPRKILLFALLMVVVTIVYILAAPFIFEILFPQYLEAIPYSQLFALTMLFLPTSLLMQRFYAHKNTKVITTVSIAEPIVLLSLYLVLIPLFGVYGVIYAILAKLTFSLFLSLYFFMTEH